MDIKTTILGVIGIIGMAARLLGGWDTALITLIIFYVY